MSASDVNDGNSTTIKYDDLLSIVSSVSQSISSFSSEVQKPSTDSNYNGLIDAGLDCGFVSEFDTNIDTLETALNSIVTSLNSAVENMQQSEQAVTDEMPPLPPEEEENPETPEELDDNPDTSVGPEDLENMKDESSQLPDESGDETGQNERPVDLQKPGPQKPNPTPEFEPNASIFATVELVCLNNMFKNMLDYNEREKLDFSHLIVNPQFADKLKQIILSSPGLSPELIEQYSSLDSIKLQQSFLIAINSASSKDKLIELGYNPDMANAFYEFAMSNYVIK